MKYYLNSIQLTVISEGTPIEQAALLDLYDMADTFIATADVRGTEISAKRAAVFAKDCGVEDFVIVDDDEDAARQARAELKKRAPYGHMCVYPERCVPTGRCPCDPVCGN